jgi:dolichol-phosphate mannosyltransferase
VIPTYNERDNLQELVARIESSCSASGIESEIVIVDDSSPDGTGAYADELARDHRMKVVHRTGKLGLSSAVLEGFKVASGDILAVMDADLSHPPEKIPEMASKIGSGEAEIVFGSRYVQGGSVENWPLHRRIISKGATMFARGLTKIKDPMSGFFMLKRSVIDGANLNPVGYKIGLEILVKGKYSKVIEVPIHFANRKAGKSKLGAGEMLKYIDHTIMLHEHKRFWLAKYLKFAIIGGFGAVINLAVLWISVEAFHVYYLWGATLAFVVADTNNFIWNRLWTFKSKDRLLPQYSQFLVVSIDGLMLNLILLKTLKEEVLPAIGIGEDKASLYLLLAQAIAIFLVSLFNFAANSFWTFSGDVKKRGRAT